MSTPTFCFALDGSPRLVSVRGGTEALLGYSQREFLTSQVHLKDRIHPDDADVADFLFSPHLEKRSGTFNMRLRHADGRFRCIKGQYSKEPDRASGEVLLDLILEDARNVREPGDASLIASFKTLIEQAGDHIYIKNRNHVILAASRTVPDFTESAKNPMELVGKTDYDIHPEEIADVAYRLEKQAIAEGRRVGQFQQVEAQDGTKHWIDNRKYPLNGPEGEIIGIFGVAPDMTEYIEAQQRLRESEESLREAQAIAQLGSFVLNIPAMTWKVSPELDALLGIGEGYTRAFEGFWTLVHPDDRAAVKEVSTSFILGERTSFDGEYRIVRHNDGAVRWVHSRGRLELDAQGKPLAFLGTLQDITESKLADMALRESEESLRESQRIAGLGSYSLDIPAGTWTRSDVMDQVFGIDKEYEHTLQGWVELVHPEDRTGIVAYLADEVLGEGKPFDKEHRIVRPSDGAVRWVHGLGRLDFDEQHRPVRMRGTIQDITERKRAEKELADTHVKLAAALAAMTDAVLITDASGEFIHFNEAFANPSGFGNSARRLANRALVERVEMLTLDGKVVPLEERPTSRALRGETAANVEYNMRRTDTGKTWIGSYTFSPIRGSDGSIAGAVVVGRDITEHKQAEAALLESRAKLEAALASMTDAVCIYDADGRMLEFNEAFAVFHRYKNKAECGTTIEGNRKFFELLAAGGEPAPFETRPAPRALRGETATDAEYTLRRKDTGETWIGSYNFAPIRDKDGAIVGAVVIARDVTEKKRAEAALRENRELLRLFIEQAPVALAMFDREMRYLAVSRRHLTDFGLAGREIIGHSHYELFPDLPEHFKEAHRRALAGAGAGDEEQCSEEWFGAEIWGRWSVHPWYTGTGAVGGIVLFTENLTERKRAETALRESKELLQLFIDRAPAALAMLDRELRYVAVSRRWLEMHSLPDADVLGHSHYEIFPEVPESWREEHRRCLAGEEFRAHERLLARADGTLQWLRREMLPWRTGDGSVGGILIFGEDITARKQAEERLRLAASVFTGAREGITITDPEGTILDVNDAFTRITGYSREEVLGRNQRILKSGLHSKEFYESMWGSLIRDGHWSGEIWNRAKSGDPYAEMLTINAIRDASGNVLQYVAHFSDLTELKQRERELEHIAHFDALTGLPNRTLLADRLRQAMAQVRRRKQMLAVAYIDLDGFKEINDRHGRNTGDRMLAALAVHMRNALREGDTLARLGGDEFVAVLFDLAGKEDSEPVLTRLLAAASEEVQVADRILRVSTSMGVTFYPQAEEVDADLLLRQADQAMCQAKLAGRNRFHNFDPALDLTVRGRNENIDHIRRALAARQFVLYYQPKVNMRTGAVIGAEALLRWQHLERGLLPPGMFLPVIEDHTLAIELGEWVIDTALAQTEAWQAAGLNLPVSVNVGALQLQQPDFVDRLKALLAAHPRVKASNLELEVLETSTLQDLAQTSQVLQACREIGVPVALDDFGTGYSSLTYLKRLPAGVLKIDRSFVSDMLDDPEDLAILEGLLGIAAAFGRQVIAEGVETVDHGLMLLQMGCELGQGYGIALPMPARDVPAWLTGWRPDPCWTDVPQVNADNQAVLCASVEHRAWLAAFDACLEGRRATPPPLDPGQCRIGAWLKAERQSARGRLPAFQAIETLHRQFHALAAEIYGSQAESGNGEGLARLRQLHCLHDKCLKRLKTFARNGSGKTGKEVSRRRAAATARTGADQ